MAANDRLTLRRAFAEGRLDEFVAQQEARDHEAGASDRLDRVIRAGAPKRAKSAGRTSHFRTADGSSGSKTRRGKVASSRR